MVAVSYCKHGVYVGGCGIDWMCQRCEDGIPDPTPRELRAELGRIVDDAEGLIATLAETTATRTAIVNAIEHIFGRRFEATERALHSVLAIAEHEDDDDYLRREHRRIMAASA